MQTVGAFVSLLLWGSWSSVVCGFAWFPFFVSLSLGLSGSSRFTCLHVSFLYFVSTISSAFVSDFQISAFTRKRLTN